jgi:hypothetical protein
MQDHIVSLLFPRGLTTTSLVGGLGVEDQNGLGVEDQQYGLRETPFLLHVIFLFLYGTAKEGVCGSKARTLDKLDN